jgi:hypothetical protein
VTLTGKGKEDAITTEDAEDAEEIAEADSLHEATPRGTKRIASLAGLMGHSACIVFLSVLRVLRGEELSFHPGDCSPQ